MNTYILIYTTITGTEYKQRFNTLFEFGKELEKAIENPYINQGSIFVSTESIKTV